MHWIREDELWFPPQDQADKDGVLAVGGQLSVPRLLLAYSQGIFPWYNPGEPPIWWCPDPRCVIFPSELKVSKSMQQVMRNNGFELRTNTAFEQVMEGCASMPRNADQGGTWITQEFVEAYTTLHRMGIAHSAECWQGEELVGGLYGVRVGKVFCGESMFSKKSNASKFALIRFAAQLEVAGVSIIDCQIPTPHLMSLGARLIPRAAFLSYLEPPAEQ